MYYSKFTGGFYNHEIHGENIPSDAVDITVEEYAALLSGQSSGKNIKGDDDGRPVLVDPPEKTLDELKSMKNAEINAARLVANSSTFPHAGKLFSCDALSRSDIDGTANHIALFNAFPTDFPGGWKAADNSILPMATINDFKSFYQSMTEQSAANFNTAQALKTRLAAATTAEQVAAIVW